MNTNKILLAGLIGGVASFFAGWLIWGILLADFMKANTSAAAQDTMRSENNMVWWALILGNLASGLLLALIFGRWGKISTLATGAKAGAVIGLLVSLYYDMVTYGTANMMTLNGTLANILANAVVFGITGAAAGWYLGRK